MNARDDLDVDLQAVRVARELQREADLAELYEVADELSRREIRAARGV